MTLPSSSNVLTAPRAHVPSGSAPQRNILEENSFQQMISLERKRTERSRKAFILMLLDTGSSQASEKEGRSLQKVLAALCASTRETDVTGWYRNHSVVGVMFTELGLVEKSVILSTILNRVSNALRDQLTAEQLSQIHISFHMYPENWSNGGNERPTNTTLYPDLLTRHESERTKRSVKRFMDIVLSVIALLVLSPVFIMATLAIWISSPGPVFFRQRRIGEQGMAFELLKFRSMHVNSDPSIHKEYATKVVIGLAHKHPTNGSFEGVYKLTEDPRVTPVGAWLRRSSLDELPQLINVLRGEMSLVGPRPPLDYEVEAYDLWHRSRLVEAKPGITGLWQVSGRNRIKFDDMVRLDLVYARTWSPWLDLKILLRTPLAVLQGAH